ncbi:MAG TPA: hypothetical protein VMG63_14275, partial [Terriglobia bacterium]|nr:hypothetical protein [Terriglobia bacterium]
WLCRLLCRMARPFRDRRLKIKLFGLSRLPESRRLSAQQAAQPHRPVANDLFTASTAFRRGAKPFVYSSFSSPSPEG